MAELWTKKKKILTRKERFRIADNVTRKTEESVEKLLSQIEEEIQKCTIEESMKYEKAVQEYEHRYKTIKINCEKFDNFEVQRNQLEIQKRDETTRQNYPQIKNLNRIVPFVNEYISNLSIGYIYKKYDLKLEIESCIQTLHILNTYTENQSYLKQPQNWYECKRNLRNAMCSKIDCYSYAVIKNIEKEMSYSKLDIMYFKDQTEFYTLALWTVLDKPKSGKDDKFPLLCHFEDTNVNVQLPKLFLHQQFVIRCFWMLNDYFSEECRSWKQNLVKSQSYFEYCQKTWHQEKELRKQHEQEQLNIQAEMETRLNILSRIKYLIPVSSTENFTTEAQKIESTDNKQGTEMSQMLSKLTNLKKSYAEIAINEERNEIENIKKYYTVLFDKFECNMRKYNIVGGVYNLELLKQPPQPKTMKDGSILRLIIGKDHLQKWDYLETYEPPSYEKGSIKESIDDDDDDDDDDEDTENTHESKLLSKFILVVIKLPEHVLWFDTPTPVHWDSENGYWSYDRIYEMKFNEEKQTVSFRVGKMTTFGLVVFKYANFPFQSWELKSIKNGEVFLNITTSVLVLEFILRRNEICLTLLENANTNALQQLIGVFYEPKVLARLLKHGGVDIFPPQDACLYVDGVPLKHCATEQHLYHCMAVLCQCYKFSWSKWNLTGGYKKFALQIQKLDCANELLLVTDQRTFVVPNTDVSPSFADIPEKFYPDLLSLAEDDDCKQSTELIKNVDPIFVETVYYFLSETRILSFS